ncbi:DUF6438 domain-containing protein [Niastella populi]|uniref:DUF6438 domain-containing protein n=1 Tax=Niastella populi TaxID=550983 RepID=A0A1V9FK57_9BACT|nr:DUF6438 domain-containing protein [Niastella populi]OQP58744.1 hypothetical protein A4R26_22520 [Niastella populi]
MKRLTFSAAIMAAVVLFSCKSQSGGNTKTADEFKLSKIVYHLSRCNGTCPSIDLEIDSNKNIYVSREFYKTKSEVDAANSGRFKGVLSADQNNRLIEVLKKSNLDSLEFTPVGIADVPETTIIIYYNGKRKYLKSERPSPNASELITLLKSIGNDKGLERTTEVKELEN